MTDPVCPDYLIGIIQFVINKRKEDEAFYPALLYIWSINVFGCSEKRYTTRLTFMYFKNNIRLHSVPFK